jgi:succinoglycan biosynthesis protein ExoV
MPLNSVVYYSETKNFGDKFNAFLFDEIVDAEKLCDMNFTVYGVGSILSKNFGFSNSGSIVTLGTGIRGVDFNPDQNNLQVHPISWSRGLFSQTTTKIEAIADGAYAFMLHPTYKQLLEAKKKPTYKLGIIPHYSSLSIFPWHKLASNTIQIISPLDDFQEVCNNILNCETVLCEAMHGAVFADMLRVPWVRLDFISKYYEDPKISYLKWLDFYSGIGLLNRNEVSIHHLLFEGILAKKISKKKLILNSYNNLRVKRIKNLLAEIQGDSEIFATSNDVLLESIKNKISNKLKPILRDGCL